MCFVCGSGGQTTFGHQWTQSKQEVELRVPLPDGTPDGKVRCTFQARRLELSWEGAAEPLAGELSEVVVFMPRK